MWFSLFSLCISWWVPATYLPWDESYIYTFMLHKMKPVPLSYSLSLHSHWSTHVCIHTNDELVKSPHHTCYIADACCTQIGADRWTSMMCTIECVCVSMHTSLQVKGWQQLFALSTQNSYHLETLFWVHPFWHLIEQTSNPSFYRILFPRKYYYIHALSYSTFTLS